MPPKPKYTKEEIVLAALELVSEKGMSDWPYLFGRSSSGETVMEKLNRKKKTIIPEGDCIMKSLQSIQKTFRVFQTLSKIAMILSFVWAGLAALGLLCGMVWYFGGNVVGANQELIYALTVTSGLTEMTGVLLVDMILALTDGTPFTQHGADRILHLGILTIVLPLVAAILSALVCELMTLPQDAVRDWGNLGSLTMGIMLILTSLIFRYGAELETKKQEEGSRYE